MVADRPIGRCRWRSGCCGRTGGRASARRPVTRTPSRARAAIRGSGTGTPASRRSSGGASSRRGPGPSWRACSPPSGRTASSATRSSGTGRSRCCASLFYNVASRSAVPDRDDPAAAAGLGLADRRRRPGEEPRIGAQMDWLAANRDLEGDGLLWIVQPDESGLDASPKFEPVWGRRSNGRIGFPLLVQRNRKLGFDARRVRDARPPGPLRDAGQHAVVALAAGAGATLGDPGPGRAALGRAARPLPRRGAARRRRGRPSSPGPRWRRSPCPTCRRRSAAAWSRSTC